MEGVKIVPLEIYLAEDGDFAEVVRINENGKLEQVPGFKLAQVNRTRLNPGSLKAWHLHLKQDEIWYVIPTGLLFVGLWDIRKDSPTNGVTMRIVLGGGKSSLLFIPQGVAHGSANFSHEEVHLFYFVNKQFNLNNPDEHRIPWDSKGADFWTPERD
ncbi:MAG: hypothetical protein A3F31_03740 [Candidatus Levybacteria bacterium RIFCSPHIGHO2_12_FULL_38_12]|nr:MAG: hypothetical protein A2770_02135 [Candidatus Levybacteria bacterium RIFCSPHIGHO2_01_FULL_38_12]OGH21938.1 MAG: hypothetical protein A3D75_00355 [Candidatus Levybacteria bacterium RIFCSPHIGHO2_02_FULL_37_18]OGH22870.1 MAG: hypothetical protein A3F31_03740 [Candidatus Levybacteria bacterium RIFCSPHIGHO2_12_FULL_38_12]OGH33595.1 MAG: hypothetical protein A3A47_01700 [Candidatus Levybacteria bacterium RIFCSPLOWO2_01_FULL_37_20]OGH44516.1 MAG: hypothetical protein A3J14_03390 [Candidatus Lev